MLFPRYDKRYLPMLWIGLALWVASMVATYVLELTGHAPEGQAMLMELAKGAFQEMPVMILLTICLIGPILEEFAFRLWGVGKLWTTIVCLCAMAVFTCGELGLWGLLLVGAFVAAWLLVKDRFWQTWCCTLVSSLAFALCHISGFGTFSLGMVLGLTDIFGMAMVMCWLVINLGFWFSPLLHVLNNTLSVMIPLLALPSGVHADRYLNTAGGTTVMRVSLEPLRPLADNGALLDTAGLNRFVYSHTGRVGALKSVEKNGTLVFVGEPEQLACRLTEAAAPAEADVFYDWESRNENLEERVVFRASGIDTATTGATLADLLANIVQEYRKSPLQYDTAEVDLLAITLVYSDGRRLDINDPEVTAKSDLDYIIAQSLAESNILVRGNLLVTIGDEQGCRLYCIDRPSPSQDALKRYTGKWDKLYEKIYGFRVEKTPVRKVRLITIK